MHRWPYGMDGSVMPIMIPGYVFASALSIDPIGCFVFDHRTQSLVDAQSNDEGDASEEEKSRVNHQRQLVFSGFKDGDQPFEKHSDDNGRDKFRQAAASFSSLPHLACADGLLLQQVLPDIEHCNCNYGIAHRLEQGATNVGAIHQ